MSPRSCLRAGLLAVALVVLACERPTGPGVDVSLRIDAAVGDGQAGAAGTQLPDPLVVWASGNDVTGVRVRWTVQAGGGALLGPDGPAASLLTDLNQNGAASAQWRLGDAGAQAVRAELLAAGGRVRESRTFTAEVNAGACAGAAAAGARLVVDTMPFLAFDGDNRRRVAVRAVASDGRGVPCQRIELSAADAASGSVAPAAAYTDSTGTASAEWSMGTAEGVEQSVRVMNASRGGESGSTASVHGRNLGAMKLSIGTISGRLEGWQGESIPDSVRISVLVDGRPFTAYPVRFRSATPGLVLSPEVAYADANGAVALQATLAPTIGIQSFHVDLGGKLVKHDLVALGKVSVSKVQLLEDTVHVSSRSAARFHVVAMGPSGDTIVLRAENVRWRRLEGVYGPANRDATGAFADFTPVGAPSVAYAGRVEVMVGDRADTAAAVWRIVPAAVKVDGPTVPTSGASFRAGAEAVFTVTVVDAAGVAVPGAEATWGALDPAIASTSPIPPAAPGGPQRIVVERRTSDAFAVTASHGGITGSRAVAAAAATLRARFVEVSEHCALTDVGDVYCGSWKTSSDVPVAGLPPLVHIASERTRDNGIDWRACGLTAEDSLWCWASSVAPAAVMAGTRFRSFDVGLNHSCAVTLEGAAYCWGSNSVGQLGDGTTAYRGTTVVRVAGDQLFRDVSVTGYDGDGWAPTYGWSCGATLAGDVYCWGAGRFAAGSDTRCTAGGIGGNVTLGCWPAPRLALAGRGIAEVEVGGVQDCGVSASFALHCWSPLGTTPPGVSSARAISSTGWDYLRYDAYSCGLGPDGAAFCWLSDGTQRGPATAVTRGLSFTAITAGSSACATTADGAIYCWRNDADAIPLRVAGP